MYRRRALRGIDLSGYCPPAEAREWLREMLAMDSKGIAGQMACHPWAVWLVWERDCIDSKRVQLLCCVGERQALYIMDWAARLDGYLCRLYQGDGSVLDISDWDEYQSVYDWRRYWRHVNGDDCPMTISPAGLAELRALIGR